MLLYVFIAHRIYSNIFACSHSSFVSNFILSLLATVNFVCIAEKNAKHYCVLFWCETMRTIKTFGRHELRVKMKPNSQMKYISQKIKTGSGRWQFVFKFNELLYRIILKWRTNDTKYEFRDEIASIQLSSLSTQQLSTKVECSLFFFHSLWLFPIMPNGNMCNSRSFLWTIYDKRLFALLFGFDEREPFKTPSQNLNEQRRVYD